MRLAFTIEQPTDTMEIFIVLLFELLRVPSAEVGRFFKRGRFVHSLIIEEGINKNETDALNHWRYLTAVTCSHSPS